MSDDPDGPPSTVGRFHDEPRPVVMAQLKAPVWEIGDNSARVIVAGAVTILFA